MSNWALVVYGWGGASLLYFWWQLVDYPAPDKRRNMWVSMSIAGIVGSLVGGLFIRAVSSDPMPGLAVLSALAGSLIFNGALLALTAMGQQAKH